MVCQCQTVAPAGSSAKLLRRRGEPASERVASQGLDPPGRSPRLVPMVLSLLHGSADAARGRASDQTVESHGAPYRAATPQLRAAQLALPPPPTASALAMGL